MERRGWVLEQIKVLVRSRRRDGRGMIMLRGSGRAVDLRVWCARSGMSPLWTRSAFVLFVCLFSLWDYSPLLTRGFRERGLLSRRVFFLFYDFICLARVFSSLSCTCKYWQGDFLVIFLSLSMGKRERERV